MAFADFSLDLSDPPGGHVTINGEDVSKYIRGGRVDFGARDLPRLVVQLNGMGKIEGRGIVEVIGEGDPRAIIEDFLAGIDPSAVDERLLADSVDEPFNTARVISELLRMLSGA